MDVTKIKTYLASNKVCFVTNSLAMPSTLLVSSLKTYIEYIPIQNFWLIPGIRDNKPFYGIDAFLLMLNYFLSNKNFDYVIYIDEDCFITDFYSLVNEFMNFTESGCVLAGPQDGGVFCHRNHSRLMINTFLSFWNIKLLRDKKITFDNIIGYISNEFKNNSNTLYKDFMQKLIINNDKLLFTYMNEKSMNMINDVKTFRESKVDLPNHETPYCKIVRDDPNNKIEPHQIPYTWDDDVAEINFEPYYIIEQALVILSDSPIYYLFGTDLYDSDYIKRNVTFDTSGLTSAIFSYKPDNEFYDRKMIAVHTWFSRAYTKWPQTEEQLNHTKRINSIIKNFSRI